MKERASLTNAVVSSAPAPIRNPRRDCSIIKSSEMAHASGGLATLDHPDYKTLPDLQSLPGQFTVEFTNLLRLGSEAFVSLLREFGLKLKALSSDRTPP